MLDSIHVAASGLDGHQKGLKVISNNVSNMNTPGYKGSNTQFTDVFLQSAGDNPRQSQTPGGGVELMPSTINFAAGEIRSTGRDMDMALSGPGFFVVRDGEGKQFYTKAGRFEFDEQGRLVTMDGGLAVLGGTSATADGLKPVDISGLLSSAFQASTSVVFSGNLSSTAGSASTTGPEHTINELTVFDSMGASHTLKVTFTVRRETPTGSTTPQLVPGTWDVVVQEGTTTLGSGVFKFSGGVPDPLNDDFTVALRAVDGRSNFVRFSLSPKATSFSSGSTSDLVKESIDGRAQGRVSKTAINDKGDVTITYTNGATATGGRIAVAEFVNTDSLQRASGALFEYTGQEPVRLVTLGKTTSLVGGSLELSNTDLTDQFSNMILIQRGFQASSQVMSTASEMIQSLFDIKSRR